MKSQNNAHAISGVHPVLFSFFDQLGNVKLDGFEHQVEHCMASGAPGVVLFGFVTQFYKLSLEEKLSILSTTAQAVKGRGRLGVTVMESTLVAQEALCAAAERAEADWLIIQPPIGPAVTPDAWLEVVTHLAARTSLPIAVQNAAIAGTTLSIEQLLRLQDQAPNVLLCKAETSTMDIGRFSREFGDRFQVMTGNWGADYPYFKANGARGFIPAPCFVAEQVEMDRLLSRGGGDWGKAVEIYGRLLAVIQFIRDIGPVEQQLLAAKLIYEMRTGYPTGPNRKPGPAVLPSDVSEYLSSALSFATD